MTNHFKSQIGQAAALLFWLRSTEIGVRATIFQCEDEGAASLLATDKLRNILDASGFTNEERNSQTLNSIVEEIDSSVKEERQLTGRIYLDEIWTGRSLEAPSLDVSAPLQRTPSIKIEGSVETVGILCLRHPLPAVLVAQKPTVLNIVKVESTMNALGVEYPMFMQVHGIIDAGPDTYIMTGIFKIPVHDTTHGDSWNSVIQNSTHFVKGFLPVSANESESFKVTVLKDE